MPTLKRYGGSHAPLKLLCSNHKVYYCKYLNAFNKRELRGKVSITKLNEILQEIMLQAEGQFSDWSA